MELYKLPVRITLQTPVILSRLSGDNVMTATADYITGSVVRGVLAREYILQHNLLQNAQLNKEFCQLFLNGAIQFGAAYLESPEGSIAKPLPLTLFADKNKTNFVDMLTLEKKEHGNYVGYKSLKGYGYMNDNSVQTISVHKAIELHMSRQSDEERIIGSSKDGKIYNYEALTAGQTFVSELVGTKENLQLLQTAIHIAKDGNIVYLGRSRHTQYGKTLLTMGNSEKIQPVDFVPAQDEDLYIYLVANYLPENDCFATTDEACINLLDTISSALQQKVELGAKVTNENSQDTKQELKNIFVGIDKVDAFVGVWGVKRPQCRCLTAGSVLSLHKDNPWTAKEVQQIAQIGWAGCGQRTAEGYGRFAVHVPFTGTLQKAKENALKLNRPAEFTEEVKKIVQEILWLKISEHLQNIAAKDVGRRLKVNNNKHVFARLEDIIMSAAKGTAKMEVKNKVRPFSRAEKTLDGLKLKGTSLKEILYGEKPQIYEELWGEVVTNEMKNLADAVNWKEMPDKENEEVYKTFWQWYCRLARKQQTGKEDKE